MAKKAVTPRKTSRSKAAPIANKVTRKKRMAPKSSLGAALGRAKHRR